MGCFLKAVLFQICIIFIAFEHKNGKMRIEYREQMNVPIL
jgi:hypothetical protein